MFLRAKRRPPRYSYTLLIFGKHRRLTATTVRNRGEAISEAGLMIDAVIKAERPGVASVTVTEADDVSTRRVGEWAWVRGDPNPVWLAEGANPSSSGPARLRSSR